MTCSDLVNEIEVSRQIERDIKVETGMDVDTVTGVLLDGGVGNIYAHGKAKEALRDRRKSIVNALAEKGC
jgi:hypothetical protein